jgi:Flp pilus assembly protein TadG
MVRSIQPGFKRRGSVFPLFTVLLVVLVGMVAFAIDIGQVSVARTQLQNYCDSGVLAGVSKMQTLPGDELPTTDVQNEVRKFVGLNDSSLTIRDADLEILRYNPTKPSGQRVSTTISVANPPNALKLTLRRDDQANGQLKLAFAPLLGQNSASVRACSYAYHVPADGVLPNAPMLPYAMQIDYYFATLRHQTYTGVDGKPISVADNYRVNPSGAVSSGSDGIYEAVLFGEKKNSPGNWGSVDIGSESNGTPELERQIRYGPTSADYNHADFRAKVAADGALHAPVSITGDPGLSTSTKTAFEEIFGKPRIIPLYDTATKQGNNTIYNVVGFAAVTVLDCDFHSNPKQLWIQPTKMVSKSYFVGGNPDAPVSYGMYTPPKLVIP